MEQIIFELKENLRKKSEYVTDLIAITQKQQEYLNKDDIEGFIAEIDKRQEYIDKINQLDETNERLTMLLEVKLKGEKAPGVLLSINNMEEGLKKMLVDLDKHNNNLNEKAQNKLEEYRKHLLELRQTKKGIEKYSSSYTSEDGIFFDKKK